MEIVFVIENAALNGGTEILARNIISGLLTANIDCCLLSVTPFDVDSLSPAIDKKIVDRIIQFNEEKYKRWQAIRSSVLNKFSGNILSDIYLRKLLREKIDEIKPRWIVSHTYDLSSAIPSIAGIKTAQMLHWSISGYEASILKRIGQKAQPSKLAAIISYSLIRYRLHRNLHGFDKLVVLSNAAKTELTGICHHLQDGNIVIIPNPLIYSRGAGRLSTLANNTIIFVGRLSYEKGVMRLLRIWNRISCALPKYKLLIYGEGDAKSDMETYIRDCHITGVKFMGFSDELERVYTNADLLCMTSDTEGFGMVLIEAMYYGVPCISFDCPVSPKEIIADAGVTITCFDEEEYANKVIGLLGDRQMMLRLQEAAVHRAENYYLDKILQKWLSMIEG